MGRFKFEVQLNVHPMIGQVATLFRACDAGVELHFQLEFTNFKLKLQLQ